MKKSLAALTALTLLTFAPGAYATEAGQRYEHFKGKASSTLPEAVHNFSEYNAKLDAVLKGKVDDDAMQEVHQLTYTLENALAKINKELAALSDKLEQVHQASERLDRDAVLKQGRDYLTVSRQIVR